MQMSATLQGMQQQQQSFMQQFASSVAQGQNASAPTATSFVTGVLPHKF